MSASPSSATPRRKTAKERVLKKIPTAYAAKGYGFYAGYWAIRELAIRANIWSVHCRTANSAWADAARRLDV